MSWVAAAIGGAAVLGAYSSNQASNKQQASAGQASQTQRAMFGQTQANLAPWMNQGKLALGDLSTYTGLKDMSYQKDPRYKALYDPIVAELDRQHIQRFGMSTFDPRADAQATQQHLDTAAKEAEQQYRDQYGESHDQNFGKLVKPFGMEDFQASPAYNFNLEQGQTAIDKAAAARHNFYAPATLQQISKYSQGLASNEFQNAFSNYNTNLKNVWDRLYALSGSGQNAAAQQGAFGTTVGGQIGENQIGAGNAAAAGQIGMANAVSGGVGSYYNTNMLSQYLASQQRSSVSGPNMGSAGANDIPAWLTA